MLHSSVVSLKEVKKLVAVEVQKSVGKLAIDGNELKKKWSEDLIRLLMLPRTD